MYSLHKALGCCRIPFALFRSIGYADKTDPSRINAPGLPRQAFGLGLRPQLADASQAPLHLPGKGRSMSHEPYAIYRHEKLKGMGAIRASSRHMTREIETPNADPSRAHLNQILIGGNDPAADVEALLPAPGSRDENGKLRRRSDSVLAVEVLLSASPEWWQNATPAHQQEWVDRSTAWLIHEYGRENMAHLRLHGDERTPHLTGFIVPLDPDTGHLNARRWLGGKARCSQQQTDYAAAVAPLGLRRGIEGSTAEHERVSRHYAQIAAPIAKLSIARPPRVLIDPEGWTAEQRENLTLQAGPTFARARTAESDKTARKAAEAQATKDRARADRLQAAMDEQKALSARLRALPLPDVLDALGFVRDKAEKTRWKAEGFNITIGEGAKASKWFDHAAGTGRGGSIDLVQHVTGSDFKGALAWLSDRFGPGAAAADLTAKLRAQAVAEVKAAVAEREPFTPPRAAPENWQKVRRYLVDERALPASYIDKLHERGDLYADAKQNAVFVCQDMQKKIIGAELKGTVGSRFTGMAPGSRKDAGGFRVGDIAKAATIYIVESAIDAISLFRLRIKAGERNHAIISTAGTTPEPRKWFAGLADSVRRVCAFDNDKAGDEAAHKLRSHKFERMKPDRKDWNDDLKADRDRARTESEETVSLRATLNDEEPRGP